jgi:hypothetical protein
MPSPLRRLAGLSFFIPGLVAPTALAQAADSLVGRWELVQFIDGQGPPELVSNGWVVLTFTEAGQLLFEFASEARAENPELPDHVGYRIDDNDIVLDVDGDPNYGQFWFEDGELRILDRERGITAHFRRRAP